MIFPSSVLLLLILMFLLLYFTALQFGLMQHIHTACGYTCLPVINNCGDITAVFELEGYLLYLSIIILYLKIFIVVLTFNVNKVLHVYYFLVYNYSTLN